MSSAAGDPGCMIGSFCETVIAFPPVLVCTGSALSIESSINGPQRRPLAAWKSSLPPSDACLECAAHLMLCCVFYLDVESAFELRGEMHGHANICCFNWATVALSLPPIKDLLCFQVLTQELQT